MLAVKLYTTHLETDSPSDSETTQMFVMVDCVRQMTVKSCSINMVNMDRLNIWSSCVSIVLGLMVF